MENLQYIPIAHHTQIRTFWLQNRNDLSKKAHHIGFMVKAYHKGFPVKAHHIGFIGKAHHLGFIRIAHHMGFIRHII